MSSPFPTILVKPELVVYRRLSLLEGCGPTDLMYDEPKAGCSADAEAQASRLNLEFATRLVVATRQVLKPSIVALKLKR